MVPDSPSPSIPLLLYNPIMNICVFGDSITYGAYDPTNGGWASLLRNYLEKNYDNINTYVLGFCGDTTKDLLKRFKSEAILRKADFIIFAIGINDTQFIYSKNDNRVSSNDFQKNIKNLFKIAKNITQKIIFAGLTSVDETKTTPIPWNTDKAYKNERIKSFNQFIKNFCVKNNLKFVPIKDLLNKNDLFDGVHPNTEGHIKIFKEIKPVVEEILGETGFKMEKI